MMTRTSHLLATLFWIGHLKPAPGTWGSAAALALALPLFNIGGIMGFVAMLLLVIVAGIWAIALESRATGQHDAKEWIIDEVAGQWIALLPAIYGAHMMHVELIRLWPGLLSAFIFFRLFDITKPWLVGRADAKATPASVMEDDLWAGVFAALATAALAAFAHLVLM